MAQEMTGISVTGNGVAYGEPDMATVELGVQITHEDLAAANEEAAQTATQLFAAMAELGIAEEDVRTAYFNVWLETNYESRLEAGPSTPQYRVSNVLSVTVRDIDQVGAVLSRGLEAGANTVNSVNYSISNSDALADEARELAVADARRKAEQLASLSGVSLGEVVMIQDGQGSSAPPAFRAAFSAEAADVPVSGGQLAVNASVQIRFALVQTE